MKKIIGLLLSVCIILSMSTGVMAYSDIEEGTYVADAVTVLSDLDILHGYEDNTFKPNATITRAEMAKVICKALNYEYIGVDKALFDDVEPKHWASGYINTAYGLGVIKGHGDGTFKPEDPVTYEEAVKMLVAALGYTEKYVANKGGYPTGYLVVGTESGITKGIAQSGNDDATRGTVARLVYNALTAPMMVQNGYNSDGSSQYIVDEDSTILTDKLDMKKLEGQVETISNSNEEVKINSITVKVGDTDIIDYFGYSVIAYIAEDENGYNYVKSFTVPTNKNTVYEVEDIKFVQPIDAVKYPSTANIISIYNEKVDDTNVEYELNDNYTIVLNGAITNDNLFDLCANNEGNITLLDSDNDGYIDYIFVTTYITDIVVNTYSKNTKIELEQYGNIDLTNAVNGKKGYSYNIVLNGEKIDIADLKEDDIISYSCDKAEKHYNILVSRNIIEGTIEEKDAIENIYVINNESYKAIDTINANVSDEVLAYINVFGEIVKFDTTIIGSKKYGFITGAGESVSVGETVYEIQILTDKGILETFTTDDIDLYNIAVNAKGSEWLIKNENVSTQNLTDYAKRIVTYKVNSRNEITDLTLLDPTIIENAEYKKNLNSLDNFGINQNTIVFSTPIDKDVTKSDFEIANINIFSNRDKYDIAVYNTEYDKNGDYEIVLVVNSLTTIGKDSSLAVITKVMSTMNDKEDKVQNITFIQNGKESILMTTEEFAVKVGDIVEFAVDANGDIDKIAIKELNNLNIAYDNAISTNTPQYVFGSVYAKSSDRVIQLCDLDDITIKERHKISEDANMIYLDLTKSTPKALVGNYGDIQAIYIDKENKLDEDRDISVLLKYYRDEVVDVIIIKGYNLK